MDNDPKNDSFTSNISISPRNKIRSSAPKKSEIDEWRKSIHSIIGIKNKIFPLRETREWENPEANSRRVNTSHNQMRLKKIKSGNRRKLSLAQNKDLLNLKDKDDGTETLEDKSVASLVTHNNIINANNVIINYHNNAAVGLSTTTPTSPQEH